MAAENWVQRAKFVWLNAAIMLGVLIGFRISPPLSVEWSARVAVYCLAFFNLLFFGVVPRIAAATAQCGVRRNPYAELFAVISERPAAAIVACVQLWGVAQCMATAVTMLRTSGSDAVKTMVNGGSIHNRLIVFSVVMAGLGGVWLAGAVGAWRMRRWAWWLTLGLNGLAAVTTIALQLFKPNEFLVDVGSTIAVIVLLLPSTRRAFGVGREIPVVAGVSEG